MRVLIQNRKTLHYYLSPKQWVQDPAQALDFERSERALNYLLANLQPDTHIVLNFDDNKLDLNLTSPVEKQKPSAQ